MRLALNLATTKTQEPQCSVSSVLQDHSLEDDAACLCRCNVKIPGASLEHLGCDNRGQKSVI